LDTHVLQGVEWKNGGVVLPGAKGSANVLIVRQTCKIHELLTEFGVEKQYFYAQTDNPFFMGKRLTHFYG
jgi:hypothetical protein